MTRYSADVRVIIQHYASLKAYVEYMHRVTSCRSCRAPTNTHTTVGNASLPVYYMNGDWLEWRDTAKELASSGPIMSSFHFFILDLEILRDFAAKIAILGTALRPSGYHPADHATYAALAKNMRAEFQTVYFGHHTATRSFANASNIPRSFCTPCALQTPEGPTGSCTCLTQAQNVPTLWRHMAPVQAEANKTQTIAALPFFQNGASI